MTACSGLFVMLAGVCGEARAQQATVEYFDGTPHERVQAAVDAWAAKLGAARPSGPMVRRQTPKGEYAGLSESFANDRTHAHAFVAVGDGDGVCHVTLTPGPNVMEQTKSALASCLQKASYGANGGTGADANGSGAVAANDSGVRSGSRSTVAARGKTAADVPASTPTPSHPENWSHVKGVYFKSSYTFGVGGMMVITYQPLILLDDGTAYEIRKAAVEDLNLDEERQAHPRDWYRWQQNGRTFVLTDYKGKADDYKLQEGSFFVAHPAEKGGMLNGSYKAVSGGGTAAVGGEMSIMSTSRMNFTPDGRMTSGSDTAIIGNGSQTGVSMAGGASKGMRGVASYKLSRYTLEVHMADGSIQRQFFAYSSHGANALLDPDMIFVGDRPYTRDKEKD